MVASVVTFMIVALFAIDYFNNTESNRIEKFNHECLDAGGTALYTLDEELVCVINGQTTDTFE
jgi:hypothetical protein